MNKTALQDALRAMAAEEIDAADALATADNPDATNGPEPVKPPRPADVASVVGHLAGKRAVIDISGLSRLQLQTRVWAILRSAPTCPRLRVADGVVFASQPNGAWRALSRGEWRALVDRHAVLWDSRGKSEG